MDIEKTIEFLLAQQPKTDEKLDRLVYVADDAVDRQDKLD